MRAFNVLTAMKNQAPSLLGPFLLIISCTLHDTGYLQEGDPPGGGSGGKDSGESGAPGTSAGTNSTGGVADGGAPDGGGAEGGDQSMAGSDTGGASGSTGTTGPCGGEQVKCESSHMIADFESNDGRLCVPGSGTVVVYSDGTGTTSPPDGDLSSYEASDDCDRGSAYALHGLVGESTNWGFGFALRFPQNIDTVEAGYTGVRFKAKAAASKKIAIKVATAPTLDASFGGSCVPEEMPEKLCNDHPASTVVVATGGWREYEVEFSALQQEGWGVKAEADFTAVLQLHVVFPGPISGGVGDYDVWLDDFEFYE
jgi:hypothetical protein